MHGKVEKLGVDPMIFSPNEHNKFVDIAPRFNPLTELKSDYNSF